jgi:hypothetical protein
MLRHLLQTKFENFWPKYSSEQQITFKKELLDPKIHLNDDETVQKNVCLVAAELARNLMGIKNKII